MVSNKISSGNITTGSVPVVVQGDESLLFMKPSDVLVVDPADLSKFLTSSPFAGNLSTAGSNWNIVGGNNSDAPSISDIVSVQKIPYYDKVTKLPKVRVLITIKNSSANATEVAGVDARIYDPTNS